MKQIIGVLGAGTMGAGIAQVAAQNGNQVILVDVNHSQLDLAKSNLSLNFNENELIHTEYSHKYHISQIKKLLTDVGFKIKNVWLDEQKHFSLTLVSKN